MPKFKVLVGMHVDADGNIHEAGKPSGTFTSDEELDAKFANKFERLDGKTKTPPTGSLSPMDRNETMDNILHPRIAAKRQAKAKPLPASGKSVRQIEREAEEIGEIPEEEEDPRMLSDQEEAELEGDDEEEVDDTEGEEGAAAIPKKKKKRK